ncbi:MAG TPA: carboxylesterase family protein [Acidimicrobiales bacterium]|jgi:para-nitrobenzyl esterase|nr:carboxylesterase family protein [Acidimicrobiales bacterium]
MTIASTTAGKVQGLDKDGVLQFRGVRFATAERFRAPHAVEPWNDLYDATAFRPIMPQNPSGLESMLGKSDTTPMDENALYLNVFTPAADDSGRPVMVWIHGGAFTAGAGSIPWYSGAHLAGKGDVVVVTINYRLGSFGFLHLDDVLGAEFAGSGNLGLRDQIAAISWVRDNIASFGGDPLNITLFGESAGGMSVATLLGVTGVPEMIRNAIPQSGAADAVKDVESAAAVTAAMLDELGLDAGSAYALLELPVAQLLAAQETMTARLGGAGALRLPFAPVVDGVVVTSRPREAVRAGAAAHVHLLVGTTSEEYKLFSLMERANGALDDQHLLARVGRVVGAERAAVVIDVYRSSRPGATNDDVWCDLATDWIFRIPAIRLAEAQAPNQPDTYSYLFTYRSTAFGGALGACHAIEVPFAFDNLDRRGVDVLLGGIDDDTHALAAATASAWLAMARAGTPQHEGLPTWPRYSEDHRAVMELGTTRAVLQDPGAAERQVWAELFA